MTDNEFCAANGEIHQIGVGLCAGSEQETQGVATASLGYQVRPGLCGLTV